MKYSKQLVLAFLGAVIFISTTGCGQKYPQAYGVYMRKGGAWIPITDATKAYPITEKPEFLIFDPRLANTAERPNSLITLHPVKWMRYSIKALVVSREAVPHMYQKQNSDRFVTLNTSIGLKFIPIKNRSNMLLVTTETPLNDGYFSLGFFDDKTLCRRNVSEKIAELPDSCLLDEWSVCMDESRGFSWDTWMTGGVFNEQLAPPQKLVSLMESLETELSSLVSSKNILALIDFCKKVERLDSGICSLAKKQYLNVLSAVNDIPQLISACKNVEKWAPDLYVATRKQCIETIEKAVLNAKNENNTYAVIGIGLMARNAGFASGVVLSELAEGGNVFSNMEAENSKIAKALIADKNSTGRSIASFQLEQFLFTDWKLTVGSSHISYKSRMSLSSPDATRRWMGDICSVLQTGPLSVKLLGNFDLSRDRFKSLDEFYKAQFFDVQKDLLEKFKNQNELKRFISTATDAWVKWEEMWGERLTIDILARPHYWSERFLVYDLPYVVERIDGNGEVLIGRVDPNATFIDEGYMPDATVSLKWAENQSLPPYDGSIRVMATGDTPVKLRIRFCPMVTMARNAFAWKFATSGDGKMRDPDKALKYAKRACAEAPDIWFVAGTYAAACAANGLFEEAVQKQEMAIALLQKEASSDGKDAAIRDESAQLALYKMKRPYVQQPVISNILVPMKWEGTFQDPRCGVRQFALKIRDRVDSPTGIEISGAINCSGVGPITGPYGPTDTRFRGKIENDHIVFTEYEVIFGDALVPTEYTAVIRGSVMDGTFKHRSSAGTFSGAFHLEAKE